MGHQTKRKRFFCGRGSGAQLAAVVFFILPLVLGYLISKNKMSQVTFYYSDDVPKGGVADQSLVGDYDYARSTGVDTYAQELSLRSNGSAVWQENTETKSESSSRVGNASWKVDGDLVWVVFPSLTKSSKVKKTPIPIPGMKDETKTDHNIAFVIKHKELATAPPSGPSAPKSRWRKK